MSPMLSVSVLFMAMAVCALCSISGDPCHRCHDLFDNNLLVVGGQEDTRDQFPWQISLHLGNEPSFYVCGGAIINSKWIVTSAHCVDSSVKESSYMIKAGKRILEISELSEQIANVSKIFVHENHTGELGLNDIALLKLEKPLTLNDEVNAISLPVAGSIPSGNALLSGWGSTSADSPFISGVLHFASLPLIDFDTCKKAIQKLPKPPSLYSGNICTGPLTGGFSACKGDGGSPLVLNTNGEDELIGIVSWTVLPCGSIGSPTVYNRISAYVDWINEKIDKN